MEELSEMFVLDLQRSLEFRTQTLPGRNPDRCAENDESDGQSKRVPKRQTGADGIHQVQSSGGRRQYPMPRTVCISLGSNSASTLCRRSLMNASTVFSSTSHSKPHTRSRMVLRLKGRPAFR